MLEHIILKIKNYPTFLGFFSVKRILLEQKEKEKKILPIVENRAQCALIEFESLRP